MGSSNRKLGDTMRTATAVKNSLRCTAENNEYTRGLYNGYEMFLALLAGKEPELILCKKNRKRQELMEIENAQEQH